MRSILASSWAYFQDRARSAPARASASERSAPALLPFGRPASRVASLADALGATRAPVDRPRGARPPRRRPARFAPCPLPSSSPLDADPRVVLRGRLRAPRVLAPQPALAPSSRARAVARAGRGGGTPGSWNLGVAHSAASAADQRAYVDRLFAAYAALVDAASEGDRRALERVMDAAYGPAPDASTTKIRDAQVRAALERACENGHVEAFEFLLDRGATFLDDAAATRGGDARDDEMSYSSAPSKTKNPARGVDAASRGHAGVLGALFRGMIHPEARDDRGRTAPRAGGGNAATRRARSGAWTRGATRRGGERRGHRRHARGRGGARGVFERPASGGGGPGEEEGERRDDRHGNAQGEGQGGSREGDVSREMTT